MNVSSIPSTEKAPITESRTQSAAPGETVNTSVSQTYYYSPALVLNPQAEVAVLEYRNPQTGAVISQYPSPQDLKAYEQHKLAPTPAPVKTVDTTPVETVPVKPANYTATTPAAAASPAAAQTSTSSVIV